MTKEELIRNLKYTMKKHKNDKLDTFGTDITQLCKDVLSVLEQDTQQVEPQERISVKDGLLDEWEIKGKKAELWIINGKLQVRYLGTIHNVELPSPYEGE